MKKTLLVITLLLASTVFAGDCSTFNSMKKQYNKISENLNLQVSSLNEQLAAMDEIQPTLDTLMFDFMNDEPLHIADVRKYKKIVGFSMSMARKGQYQVDYIWGLLDEMIQTQWTITGSCQSRSSDFGRQKIEPAMERSELLLEHYDRFISKIEVALNELNAMGSTF